MEGRTRFHSLCDHLGTPQELLDENRNVVWAADFDAYGQMQHQFADKIDNPIRFPGQYRDKESGLYYNRHRYYDRPESGGELLFLRPRQSDWAHGCVGS
ncbi:RHS repeat domain-containing protein [Trinickia sp.]|uniref:RHS repeat domain-containing protein n=1 Tax=Trinickia sp. TaxID=2571163 RepID=UPI003F80D2C1